MQELKTVTSHAPFLGKLLKNALHQNEDINQETGNRQSNKKRGSQKSQGDTWVAGLETNQSD